MLHAVTTYLTLLIVCVCPAICLTGAMCPVAGSAAVQPEPEVETCRCCCRHETAATAATADNDRDRSARKQDSSDGGSHPPYPHDDCQCHCLCDGAVLDDAALPADMIIAGLYVPTVDAVSATSDEADQRLAAPVDTDAAAGLCARIALCSLLC